MNYERPISGRFTGRATIPSEVAWTLFVRTLQRKGRARICVTSILEYEGQQAGHFEGEFVAMSAEGA